MQPGVRATGGAAFGGWGCGCGEQRPSRGRATRPGPSLRNLECRLRRELGVSPSHCPPRTSAPQKAKLRLNARSGPGPRPASYRVSRELAFPALPQAEAVTVRARCHRVAEAFGPVGTGWRLSNLMVNLGLCAESRAGRRLQH